MILCMYVDIILVVWSSHTLEMRVVGVARPDVAS